MTPPDDDYAPELPPLDAYDDIHEDPHGDEAAATNGHHPPSSPPAVPPPPRPRLTVVAPAHTSQGALADGHRPTDAGNADRLAARITREARGHDADGLARWVAKWQKWIVYRDGAWRVDDGDALITEQAKAVARDLFALAVTLDGGGRDNAWKWAKRSESAAAISSMIRLCRGTARIEHHELDRHPWLLNCTNGTIDLRSGALLDPDPEHLLTCQTPVPYEPGARSALWEDCLATWQPDPEVRSYLQAIAGAGTTGHATEVAIVNLGTGGNGKGKFWGALQGALGPDYAVTPDKSLIVAQRHDEHATVKARLRGARLAVAGETEAGDRLDEAKVKELTGGDLLEARRMREDPWQFAPSHTLVLHTNYRPKVRGGDEGIWRRLRLIPWPTTIAAGDRDPRLADRLQAEAAAILAWMVAGAVAHIAAGARLAEPEPVRAATDAYRAEEDHVGRFLTEACATGADDGPDAELNCASRALRTAYEAWCDEVGEQPWSATAIGRDLTSRGFDSLRRRGPDGKTARYWIGLDVLHDDGRPTQVEAF